MGKHKRIPSVYILTFPNKKMYVGQTVWPVVRMNRHKNGKHSKCPAVKSAIKKYGWDNVNVEWIVGGPNDDAPDALEEELNDIEEEHIAFLDTLAPNGYNIQIGGKVAWREASGLSRTAPRGPRTEELKQQLRDTWEQKREERLQKLPNDVAQTKRLDAKKQQESRAAKRVGTHVDGRFEPSERRCTTWEKKREAKYALMPPEQAEKKRKTDERARNRSKEVYYAKKHLPQEIYAQTRSCETQKHPEHTVQNEHSW